jgi:hypothetical protein
MFVFRSLVLGLLGACALLLAVRPAYDVHVVRERLPVVRTLPAANAAIVDVAHGVPIGELAGLIRMNADEHVYAVNDRPVVSELDAGAVIASLAPDRGSFIDLTITGAAGQRRVLVLLH